MRDGTYPSRNLATLGPSGLRPPFTGIYIKNIHFFKFILQHRADVRFYTSYYYFAKSYVFNKQSSFPLCFPHTCALYPEVTESFCRVPLISLAPLPYFFQKIHVCSNIVRSWRYVIALLVFQVHVIA